ncbi:MAG: hemerythrin [Bacteroidetes bacterium]|nr:hemerythrin [Bacteroidota bacterium]
MESITTKTVREMVTDDHRSAAVFEKYAIDFCCNGGTKLVDACSAKGVDPAVVVQDLQQLWTKPDTGAFRPDEWDLDALADFIVNTHHRYVRKSLPLILPHVDKILSVHGKNHPELKGIAEHFHAIAAELTSHMHKEEMVLFPCIKNLVNARNGIASFQRSPFGSIRNPIAMMEAEHRSAGDSLAHIRQASNGFNPPPDACTTYTVTYRELEDFERDLHQHIHLENNILFPKAIALEDAL